MKEMGSGQHRIGLWMLLLLFFGGSGSVFASEAVDCARKAAGLGKGVSSVELDVGCVKAIFNRAPASQVTTSPFEKFSAAGFENVIGLYAQNEREKFDFISGSNTGLQSIEALALSTVRKEVWILNRHSDGSKDIRVFISRYGGNLAPVRVYRGAELAGASLIQLSRSGDEVALWFPRESLLRIFPVEPSGSSREIQVNWKRTLKVPVPAPESVQTFAWISHKHLFALASGADSDLSVFKDPANGNDATTPYSRLSLSSKSPLTRLYWSEKVDGLQALYQDGTTSLLRTDP